MGWQAISGGIIISILLLIAYSNSFEGPFVFDGKYTIRDNYNIRQLWPIWEHIISPMKGSTVDGRPVANLSLVLNYAINGSDVAGYHAFNLVVHLLSALACFGLVSRTLALSAVPEQVRKRSFVLGLGIALLWALHPMQTAAVTYINQRVEAMMGLFYLSTLYCFVRGATSPRGLWWYIASVASCTLGMATKEVMVSAPLMVILYDRVFLAGSFKAVIHKRLRVHLAITCTWILLAVLAIRTGDRNGTAGFTGEVSGWQYLLTQCDMIVRYIRLSIWPHPLVFYYGKERLVDSFAQVWPQAASLLVLFTGSLIAMRYRPWLGFLGIWFFAILSPSSSFIPIATELGAEHRMYLSLLSIVSLVVIGGFLLHVRLRERKFVGLLPVLVVLILAFGLMSFSRNQDYRTLVSLWKDTTEHDPTNYGAFDNLGCAYREAGEYQNSVDALTRSIELNPDCEDCYQERGHTYATMGDHEKSLADYGKAIEMKPDFYIVYYKRGSLLLKLGRYDEALEDFDKSVELEERFTAGYDMRGYTHLLAGRHEEAMNDFTQAIEINPNLPNTYHHRAELFY